MNNDKIAKLLMKNMLKIRDIPFNLGKWAHYTYDIPLLKSQENISEKKRNVKEPYTKLKIQYIKNRQNCNFKIGIDKTTTVIIMLSILVSFYRQIVIIVFFYQKNTKQQHWSLLSSKSTTQINYHINQIISFKSQ